MMNEDDLEIEIDLTEINSAPAPTAKTAGGGADFRAAHPPAACGPVRAEKIEGRPLGDARPAQEARPAHAARTAAPVVTHAPGFPQAPAAHVTLPPRFEAVVSHIGSPRVRELVSNIYARQVRALDVLSSIEKLLTSRGGLRVAPLFFELRSRCASLLSYITAEVASSDLLDDELRSTLDCMRFVVAHETGKVFRGDFPRKDGGEGLTRAEVARAWGLMQNCLQQTAITLAQVFDPAACGETLFDNYQHKVEDSLTLFRELKLLLRKVRRAEESNGILLKHSLVMHLELFCGETMHLLMYKDWAEFEGFVDEVKRSFEEMDDFDITLHKFASYLETLIYHVGMREVLKNPDAPGGAPDGGQARAGDDPAALAAR